MSLDDLAHACASATDVAAVRAARHEHQPASDELRVAADAVVAAELGRVRAEAALADLTDRVDNAQRLANMGDYHWDATTDTNRWSDQLYRIYGYEPQEFNASFERFLSLIHPDDRDRIAAIIQNSFATGEPYRIVERVVRPSGEIRHLSSNGQVVLGPDGVPTGIRGTCVDVTERVLADEERERNAAAMREADLRRKQALELNDNVVQGLTAAGLAADIGDVPACMTLLDDTLEAARRMMDEWLDPLGGRRIAPGDLVRSEPSHLRRQPTVRRPAAQSVVGSRRNRVLIVDDNQDLRMLARIQVEADASCEVVGEAGDGYEAVILARELQPDAVLLDLAMPRMDGVEALPLLLEAVPGVRVVVISGFDQTGLRDQLLETGAARYVEKGVRMNLGSVVRDVLRTA